jgi:hypothetical protein
MLATVISTTDPVQAHIIRGRLQAEGLHPSVAFEHHIRMNWFISNALGGVRVQVPPSENEEAVEIIKKISQEYYLNLLEEDEKTRDDLCCPSCASRNVKRSRVSESLALVIFLFLKLPFPYQTGAYYCQSCKHRWVSQRGKGISVMLISLVILLAWSIFVIVEAFAFTICKVNQLSPSCY